MREPEPVRMCLLYIYTHTCMPQLLDIHDISSVKSPGEPVFCDEYPDPYGNECIGCQISIIDWYNPICCF